MIRAFKIELQTQMNTWILPAIILVLVLFSSISIFTGVYPNQEIFIASICGDTMVLLMAGAIYVGISTISDYSNGFIKHYLVSGVKRVDIIIGKYLSFILGCILILFLYPILSYLLSYFSFGGDQFFSYLLQLLSNIFMIAPFYIMMYTLFFALAILIRKESIVIGVNIALSVVLTVVPQRFLADLEMLKYTPTIQIQMLCQNSAFDKTYLISLLLGTLFCILILYLVTQLFKRIEF